jgi:hypothetical protein
MATASEEKRTLRKSYAVLDRGTRGKWRSSVKLSVCAVTSANAPPDPIRIFMFYVTRNAHGEIATIARVPQGNDEALDDQHPDVQAFLSSARAAPHFSEIDADFIRVIEDVVDTLIAKNVIRLTDLPIAAQKKMTHRQNKRSQIIGALNLLDNDNEIL